MAIVDRETVKTILKIEGTEEDALIDILIPLVEDHFLDLRNAPFDTDDDGVIVYPKGSELTAALMVGYQLKAPQNAEGKTSESLGDYSYTIGEIGGGYPENIIKQIRRYVGLK